MLTSTRSVLCCTVSKKKVWNRTDFWLKCGDSAPKTDCTKAWGSWGSKKYFDFSQPALREWYLGTYLNSSLHDPLFDGAFFDCACGP